MQKASASGGRRPQTPYLGYLTGGLPSPEPPDWPMFILGLSLGEIPPKRIALTLDTTGGTADIAFTAETEQNLFN